MIGTIERALLERLRWADARNLFGGPLSTIASYAGELSGVQTDVQRMPAIWVAYAGETAPIADGPEEWRAQATFMLFAATWSGRSGAAARLEENEGEIGSYRLLMVARAILAGHDLGLKIEPLAPGAIVSEDQADGRSVYSLELTTRYAFRSTRDVDDDQLADFLHLHLDWDIEPAGEVVPPLPAEQADQRDDIFLTERRA